MQWQRGWNPIPWASIERLSAEIWKQCYCGLVIFWHFLSVDMRIFGIFCDSGLAIFCDRGHANFCNFSVTANPQTFANFLLPQTCEFLAIFLDCGPASFWHFSKTVDLSIFSWPWTSEFLAFFVTMDLQFFAIFTWLHTCKILSFSRDRGPASFWLFHDRRSASFGIFSWPRTCKLWHFSWLRTASFWHFFQNCWPQHYWHISMIIDQRVFGIFLWLQTCNFLPFLLDCGPASFCHFFLTADVWILGIFCDHSFAIFLDFYSHMLVFGIFRDCRLAIFLLIFCDHDQQVFGILLWLRTWNFFLAFFVTVDLRVFGIFPWTWTCNFLAFFHNHGPANFVILLWQRTC